MPRTRFRSFTGVLACALMLALPLPAMAQSALEPHLGPLADVLEPGRDEAWTIGTEGGWATFRNTTDPGTVRYYWTELSDMADTDFSVDVTLFAQSNDDVPMTAGLVFNFKGSDSYFAVTIASDGTPSVIVRNADGFQPQPIDTTAARLDGSDILRLEVTGTNVHAMLNGDTLINANFGGPVSRKAGVIVYGTGVAGFTGLTVEAMETGSGLPTPGGDATLPTPGGDRNDPPQTPAADDNGPPPVPDGDTDGPPPIPGGGNDGPPPIPGGDTNGPPPIPGGDTNGPPPVPDGDTDGPPPIPRDTTDGPPPIPGQNQPTAMSAIDGLTREQAERRLGVALGIYLHEMAHAVIGETGLPATGPEEDTADSFSAFTMANMTEGATPQTQDFVVGVIESSTLLWYYAALAFERHQVTHDWQDEHAPNIKRFRNSFCIIYGSNPQLFEPVAGTVDFTDRSKQRCAYEYQKSFEAWDELLALRGRNLGPDMPGRFPANEPGGKLNLTFQPSQSEYGRKTEELLKYQNLVPGITQLFEQYFVWPRDVTITFRDCEEINAWYNPMEASVTMCYSAIEFYEGFLAQGLAGQN